MTLTPLGLRPLTMVCMWVLLGLTRVFPGPMLLAPVWMVTPAWVLVLWVTVTTDMVLDISLGILCLNR